MEGVPVQLRQVLLNPVINGFDAMCDTPASDRKVEITSTSNGDGTVRASVRDHGSGLSETALTHLFNPFFTTKKEGLGTGFVIVRSIVESHGGKIGVENVDDGCALFSVTFTAAPAPSC